MTLASPSVRSCNSKQRCTTCTVRVSGICSAFNPEDLSQLDAIAQPVSFPARQTLFLEAEKVHALYAVTEGTLRLYQTLPNGRRQIVGFALPGDFVGLSLGKNQNYSADAVSCVTTCRFSYPMFERMVSEKPALLRRLHELASNELIAAQAHITSLGRFTADEKIANFLIELQNRWVRVRGLSSYVPVPMSRQDIADFLGVTIETVSRTISRFAREGIIETLPRAIRLIDLKRLQNVRDAVAN